MFLRIRRWSLDAAHGAGIVHRDLKRANVFLATDEGVRFPKVLDFGIAKLMRGDTRHSDLRTETGVMLGTPHYVSPEQCRGADVDYRTHIYAFGVMVHGCSPGHLPFDSQSLLRVMNMHAYAPPPPMSQHNTALPVALHVPVLRMLEKEADRRPKSRARPARSSSKRSELLGHVCSRCRDARRGFARKCETLTTFDDLRPLWVA